MDKYRKLSNTSKADSYAKLGQSMRLTKQVTKNNQNHVKSKKNRILKNNK
jgi:hypothetical protein